MGTRAGSEAKLLDAADLLFFARGIAATPIDAVIAQAGVSSATLYRAYPSKDALVAAALRRRHVAWIRAWDAAIDDEPTGEGKLLAVFPAIQDFREQAIGSRWCAFLGSAAEYADPPAVIADAIRADTDTLRDRLAALAAPLVGGRAAELADRLLLVVTGDLAMRLRGSAHDSAIARGIAAILVADARTAAT